MGVHHGVILGLLRDYGPLSRAELARRTQLSATALTNLMAQLLEDGCVEEVKEDARVGVGRPPVALGLRDASYRALGVHIGGGRGQIVLCNLRTEALASATFCYEVGATTPDEVVTLIANQLENLLAMSGSAHDRIIGVGFAVPGPVDKAQRRALFCAAAGWKDVSFAQMLEEQINLPVVLEHNVSAMAQRDSRYGLGKNSDALLYLYLRSGVGAGLVVEGKPFRPGGIGTVELGHIPVANGPGCACGAEGCLEALVGEAALRRALGIKDGEILDDPLFVLVDREPQVRADVLRYLEHALVSAINMLSVDFVVLGGHLAAAPQSFIAVLETRVKQRVLAHARQRLRIVGSTLDSNLGGLGAASVALDHFFYSGAFK